MFPDNEPTPEEAELEGLSAYIDAIEGHSEKALAQLAGREDPESVLRTLTILLGAQRYREAADLVRGKDPHARWSEQAVHALVSDCDLAEARRIVEWSRTRDDLNLWRSCVLALATARYQTVMKVRSDQERLLPGELKPMEIDVLREVIAILQPLLLLVEANRRVDTGLEAAALSLALEASFWLNDRSAAERHAKYLLSRKPLPIAVAYAVLRKLIAPPDDLPKRLRDERPHSFQAKSVAALIEGQLLGRPRDAVDAAFGLVSEAMASGKLEDLVKLLVMLSEDLPVEDAKKVEEMIRSLQPEGRFGLLREAQAWLQEGRVEDAGKRLDELRDDNDSYWLQLYGFFLSQIGKDEDALEVLIKACDRLPDPILIRQTAGLARKKSRTDVEASLLERYLLAEPKDLQIREHLASLYATKGDFERAGEHFRVLAELEPDKNSHVLNRAASLEGTLDLEGSLVLYEAVCRTEEPPVRAVVGRALLLKRMNRVAEAFESLRKCRGQFWDDPGFVASYLDVAYASEQETSGHEALIRLQELKLEGKAGDQVLQAVPIEEVRSRFLDFQENSNEIHAKILDGQATWLLADQLNRRSSYVGWWMRTQPLPWVPDDPVRHAEFTIYSTNGFTESNGLLQPLECAERGTRIAADLSSLITLHRLGLLAAAAEFFGQILVPSVYLSRASSELDRLIPHQLSSRTAQEAIKSALDMKAICVLGPNSGEDAGIPIIHEHIAEESLGDLTLYGIRDLAVVLHDAGRISDELYQDLNRAARVRPSDRREFPPLHLNQPVFIHLLTLETLSRLGGLDQVLRGFRVHVNQSEADEVARTVRFMADFAEIRSLHVDLWMQVRNDPRFVKIPAKLPPELQNLDQDIGGDRVWAIASGLLAMQENVPLLADDRVAQAMLCGERPNERVAAFGTDRLLVRLADDGSIDRETATGHFMQLLSWRYKFIILPHWALDTLARKFIQHPPGIHLRAVARYAQDSMRDPGLFTGLVRVNPPSSIASQLLLGWATTLADFVMTVWMDRQIDDARASALTEWAMSECLPTTPGKLGALGRVLAAVIPMVVFSQSIIRSATGEDSERMNRGLRAIAMGLGVSDEEYLALVTEIFDALLSRS